MATRKKPARKTAPAPKFERQVPAAPLNVAEPIRPVEAQPAPIRIFQIYFEPWQRELLDPVFCPFDSTQQPCETMEFAVFEQLQQSPATEGAGLWGALSWRFSELTGMLGRDWLRAIEANPGADVYFCHPYPADESVFHNSWRQAEVVHPRFLEVCQAFFEAAGLPLSALSSIHHSGQFAAANCLVGTPRFWASYIPFVKRALEQATRKMAPALRDLMHSMLTDEKSLHGGSTYVPFIVERLLPLFLMTEGQALKSHKIALPERERELNVHQRLLREMKDVAHKTQSAWLAACWVNYRNLYLSQTHGQDWSRKHLRAITPTEVRFA